MMFIKESIGGLRWHGFSVARVLSLRIYEIRIGYALSDNTTKLCVFWSISIYRLSGTYMIFQQPLMENW